MHLDLETITLKSGAHSADSGECCVLELYSCVMKKKWGDHPDDVCPVIGDFMRRWNDTLNDEDRQALKVLIPVIVASKTTKEDEKTRAWMIVDWMTRTVMPLWLDAAELPTHAVALRESPPITNKQTADTLIDLVKAAEQAAYANAYANANANANAYANAIANAYANAIANANANANAIANAIAIASANANAYAKLRPTVVAVQASAIELVKRMCAAGKP